MSAARMTPPLNFTPSTEVPDLLPGLLVVGVVDFNDVAHILSAEVVFTPAPPAGRTRPSGQIREENRAAPPATFTL
ncbi:hypothetical protein EYF80_050242 [Liparis tanakae]|uniref:Uncharacterized protein n=1 Tax=Liparis tanakae TaxID=230148 RepID=A0A4Z2FEF8_9TELE|nr:hypothetical protein EYF80_050242 [Liparis tanakae]